MKFASCHPERKHYSAGTCRPCYNSNVTEARRQQAVMLLGGACAACGLSDWRILEIDHIDGRKGESTMTTLLRVVVSGDFSGLQILCPNCHAIKTFKYRFEVK